MRNGNEIGQLHLPNIETLDRYFFIGRDLSDLNEMVPKESSGPKSKAIEGTPVTELS